MKRRVLLSLIILLTARGSCLRAQGIATKFADVIMEQVTPGKVYNLRTMRNLPYRVVNMSSATADLSITVEIPQKDALKPDYEAIPDPSWIRVVPSRMKLNAGEEGLADIILQAPDDPLYRLRHFQANIVCQTAEPPPGEEGVGLAFRVALASRLRFSVGGPGPESVRRMQKKGIYQQLNFTLEPDSFNIPGFLAPGKRIELTELGGRISLINRSSQKLEFSLKTIIPPAGISAATGYESAPEPSWLEVKPDSVKVPGESMKSVSLALKIPDQPEYRGKRYLFVVRATLKGREIPVEVYSRVYVNIAK